MRTIFKNFTGAQMVEVSTGAGLTLDYSDTDIPPTVLISSHNGAMSFSFHMLPEEARRMAHAIIEASYAPVEPKEVTA